MSTDFVTNEEIVQAARRRLAQGPGTTWSAHRNPRQKCSGSWATSGLYTFQTAKDGGRAWGSAGRLRHYQEG